MFIHNITTSLKRFINNKFYTVINISGLSLSFAITIIILLYVHNEFTTDKNQENLHNLYRLVENKDKHCYTAAKFADYIINKYPEVKYVSRYVNRETTLKYGDNQTIKIDNVAFMDSSCLDMFTINIVRKNTDKLLRTNQSILISQSTAKRLFGEKDPLGQTIKYDMTLDFVVEGIFEDYPPNSCFKHEMIAYYPSVKFIWGYPDYDVLESEGNWSFTTFLQLNEGVNKDELNIKIQKDLVERFGRPTEFYLQEFSDIYFNNDIFDYGVRHGKKQIVYLFLTIALIIIIIAMINYINLSTSISTQRALNVGINKTLGAHRINLIVQFMIETILICLISLILGYILAELFMPTFNNLLQYNLKVKLFYVYPFNIISVLFAIFIGLISGLYPSLYLTRFSPVEILKGKVTTTKNISLFKKGLMIFQFIITITLVTGTIIVYKQLNYWRNMDLGIDRHHTLILELTTDFENESKSFQEKIRGIASVEKTCFSNGTAGDVRNGLYDNIDGQKIMMRHLYVNEDYFDLYGIQIADGQGFSKGNPDLNKEKYLLNEAAVKYLNWENAYEKDIWKWKCIGVVKDFNFASQHNSIGPLFISYTETNSVFSIKISSQNIPSTIKQIKEIWEEFSQNYPFEYRFLDDVFDAYYKNEERLTKILGYFSVFSIFIACLGLFGLISFMAEQRTKEIGIRKANGANVRNIILLFSKEFIQLVIISGIIAIPLSYYLLSKWLQNFAYSTKISWWVFAISILLAVIISYVSILYRAYRAASQNPVDALRYE